VLRNPGSACVCDACEIPLDLSGLGYDASKARGGDRHGETPTAAMSRRILRRT
jgi:hypothetical protein